MNLLYSKIPTFLGKVLLECVHIKELHVSPNDNHIFILPREKIYV